MKSPLSLYETVNSAKRLFIWVALLGLTLTCQAQSNIVFFLNEFNAFPATNRTVVLQAVSPFLGNNQFMASDGNGVLITNLNVGVLYNGTIKAPPANIPFQIYLPTDSGGCLDATNYVALGNVSTYPAGAVAPSVMMADSRYARSGISLSNTFYPLYSNPSNYITATSPLNSALLYGNMNILSLQVGPGALTGDLSGGTNFQGTNVTGTIPALPLTNALIQADIVNESNVIVSALIASNAILAGQIPSGGISQAALNSTNALIQTTITTSSNVVNSALVASNAPIQATIVSASNILSAALVASNAIILTTVFNASNAPMAAIILTNNALIADQITTSNGAIISAQTVLNLSNAAIQTTITTASNLNAAALVLTNTQIQSQLIVVSNQPMNAIVATNVLVLQTILNTSNGAVGSAQAVLNTSNALIQAAIVVASNSAMNAIILTNNALIADHTSTSNGAIAGAQVILNLTNTVIQTTITTASNNPMAAIVATNAEILASVSTQISASQTAAQTALNSTNAVIQATIVNESNVLSSALVSSNAPIQATIVNASNVLSYALVASNAPIQAAIVAASNAPMAALVSSNALILATANAALVGGTNAANGYTLSASNSLFYKSSWIQAQVGGNTNFLLVSGAGSALANGTNVWSGTTWTNISGNSYVSAAGIIYVSSSPFYGSVGGNAAGSIWTNINGTSPAPTAGFMPRQLTAGQNVNISNSFGVDTISIPGSGLTNLYAPLTLHSNVWNLATATNGMLNFDTRFHVSSNGFPVDIYQSNGVPFIYYETSQQGGILP